MTRTRTPVYHLDRIEGLKTSGREPDLTRKRKRPFSVYYLGQFHSFPANATWEDVERWKKYIHDWVTNFREPWFDLPDAVRFELMDMFKAAEQRAWKRDHPGKPYPEHECAMSKRQVAAYWRWRERWEQSPAYRRLVHKRQLAFKANNKTKTGRRP
jgi:hypothetical protein